MLKAHRPGRPRRGRPSTHALPASRMCRAPRPRGPAAGEAEANRLTQGEGWLVGQKLSVIKLQNQFPAGPDGVQVFRDALRVVVLHERLSYVLKVAPP